MQWLVAIAVVMLVSGCAEPNLRALRKAEPSKDPFLAALSKRYLSLSEEEARQYDWFDSVHFSDKGLAAAYGHEVKPDAPESRDLNVEFQSDLRGAYATLTERLTEDAKQQHPADAAKAVSFYDCWLEQAEEAWQKDDINSCRLGFFTALRAISEGAVVDASVATEKAPVDLLPVKTWKKAPKPNIVASKKVAPQKTVVKKPAVKASKVIAQKKTPPIAEKVEATTPATPELEPVVSDGRAVLFYRSGMALSQKSEAALATLTERLKKQQGYRLTIHGYTDNTGDEASNLELSYKRAEQLKKKLVKSGLKPENIHVFAFGGTDAKAVDAEDRAANQRVEMLME